MEPERHLESAVEPARKRIPTPFWTSGIFLSVTAPSLQLTVSASKCAPARSLGYWDRTVPVRQRSKRNRRTSQAAVWKHPRSRLRYLERPPSKRGPNLGVQLQASSFQSDLSVFDILKLYSGLYGVDTSKLRIDAILADFQLTQVADRKTRPTLRRTEAKRLISHGNPAQSPRSSCSTNQPQASIRNPAAGCGQRMETMRDDGCGIVLTTHSMEEAHSTCDPHRHHQSRGHRRRRHTPGTHRHLQGRSRCPCRSHASAR